MTREREREIAELARARVEGADFDAQLHGLAVKLNAGKGSVQDRAQFDALQERHFERPIDTTGAAACWLADDAERWCFHYHVMRLANSAGVARIKALEAERALVAQSMTFWAGVALARSGIAAADLDGDDSHLLALLLSRTGPERRRLSLRQIAAQMGVALPTLRRRVEALRGNKNPKIKALIDGERPPRGGTRRK